MTRILFVDDEANVLSGFRRNLGGRYDCVFAQGAAEALSELHEDADIGVVITDMRMPGLNGLDLIDAARPRVPHAVFLMLTGNADVTTAVEAVNRGRVFRFLTKPCPPETLYPALEDAIRQHERIVAEEVLLRRTVTGAVRLFSELTELANPTRAAFNARVRRAMRCLVEALGLPDAWAHESAALLCQVGRFALPPALADADPDDLDDPADRELVRHHPVHAGRLLHHVPHLDRPGRIVAAYPEASEPAGGFTHDDPASVEAMSAAALRVAVAFAEAFETHGQEAAARHAVRERLAKPCPAATRALLDAPPTECEQSAAQLHTLDLHELRPGMFTAGPIHLTDGRSLLGRGRELTGALIAQVHACAERGLLAPPFDLLIPDGLDLRPEPAPSEDEPLGTYDESPPPANAA